MGRPNPMIHGLVALAVALVAAVAPHVGISAARAAPKQTTAVANMVKQAYVAYEAGDYARAADLYLAAWRVDPRAEYLWSVARAYHLAGQRDKALEQYRVFLKDPGELQAKVPKAQDYVAEIEAAKIADRVAEAEKLERSGQGQLAALMYLELGRANPARRDLLFRAAVAYQNAGQSDAAVAALQEYLKAAPADAKERAEAETRLKLLQAPADRAAPPKASSPDAPKATAVESPDPGVHRPAALQGSHVARWATVGAGVAVLGGGAALWLATRGDASDLEGRLTAPAGGKITALSKAEAQAEVDTVNTRLGVAYGAMAAGAAAAAVGWFVLADGPPKVAVLPGPGDAGVALVWRY